METASLNRGGPIIVLICSTKYRRTEIISRKFKCLTAKTQLPQRFDCERQANPVCWVPRAVAVVRGALPRDGALRRQSSKPGWRPRLKGAAGLRRDCQAGGGYRKPEVGRTLLWSGGAMLPRLGLEVGRSAGRWRSVPLAPRRRLGRRSLAPVGPERLGASHGTAHAHRCEPPRRDPGGRR